MKMDSKLYFIWSGWNQSNITQGYTQNLYIAQMESPSKINSTRVLIAEPSFDWEKKGVGPNDVPGGLLEGPEVLVSPKGKYFITFSASASWTQYYTIGALELKGDNPLNASHWYHYPKQLFAQSESNGVYGVGHASFVKSKDGKEEYIVYHAMSAPNGGWGGRTTRIQSFTWEQTTGYPNFGVPQPTSKVFTAPSGECSN